MFFRRSLGRPVRIASVSFQSLDLRAICAAVDEAAHGSDLVVLPETMRGKDFPEPLEGPSIEALAKLARSNRAYIVCPIDRIDNDGRWNSTVLLNRQGEVACIYDKVHPFLDELELDPPRQAGTQTMVFDTDFGRLGFATCFDVNFPDHWQQLARLGAELVVFPSAYSTGRSLQAHSINHNYYSVSATQVCDASVYDITGDRLLHKQGRGVLTSRITLDLDRCIFHVDFNQEARARLLAEHGAKLHHKELPEEGWFVLSAAKAGVSARALAAEFGLEELRHYRQRVLQMEPALLSKTTVR